MDDREALELTCLAHPQDDTPKLVLADWLDEHHEEEKARWLRLFVAVQREDEEKRRLDLLFEMIRIHRAGTVPEEWRKRFLPRPKRSMHDDVVLPVLYSERWNEPLVLEYADWLFETGRFAEAFCIWLWSWTEKGRWDDADPALVNQITWYLGVYQLDVDQWWWTRVSAFWAKPAPPQRPRWAPKRPRAPHPLSGLVKEVKETARAFYLLLRLP